MLHASPFFPAWSGSTGFYQDTMGDVQKSPKMIAWIAGNSLMKDELNVFILEGNNRHWISLPKTFEEWEDGEPYRVALRFACSIFSFEKNMEPYKNVHCSIWRRSCCFFCFVFVFNNYQYRLFLRFRLVPLHFAFDVPTRDGALSTLVVNDILFDVRRPP